MDAGFLFAVLALHIYYRTPIKKSCYNYKKFVDVSKVSIMQVKDYRDKQGIQRRVLVPDDSTPPEMGIPVSLRLDEALKERGWTNELITKFYDEAWARGLVTSADYGKPESPMLLRSAINATYLVDAQFMQTIAKEQSTNGNSDSKHPIRGATR